MSGILSMSCNDIGCVLGGFAGNSPVLIWYNGYWRYRSFEYNTIGRHDICPVGRSVSWSLSQHSLTSSYATTPPKSPASLIHLEIDIFYFSVLEILGELQNRLSL